MQVTASVSELQNRVKSMDGAIGHMRANINSQIRAEVGSMKEAMEKKFNSVTRQMRTNISNQIDAEVGVPCTATNFIQRQGVYMLK